MYRISLRPPRSYQPHHLLSPFRLQRKRSRLLADRQLLFLPSAGMKRLKLQDQNGRSIHPLQKIFPMQSHRRKWELQGGQNWMMGRKNSWSFVQRFSLTCTRSHFIRLLLTFTSQLVSRISLLKHRFYLFFLQKILSNLISHTIRKW